MGFAVSWRWQYATGPRAGYAEVRGTAPDRGFISSTAVGTGGELIVFVDDPDRPFGRPILLPSRCASVSSRP